MKERAAFPARQDIRGRVSRTLEQSAGKAHADEAVRALILSRNDRNVDLRSLHRGLGGVATLLQKQDPLARLDEIDPVLLQPGQKLFLQFGRARAKHLSNAVDLRIRLHIHCAASLIRALLRRLAIMRLLRLGLVRQPQFAQASDFQSTVILLGFDDFHRRNMGRLRFGFSVCAAYHSLRSLIMAGAKSALSRHDALMRVWF
ncbi:hypothetical protein G5V57_08230 [Nordella sp. HKS 07]|uniref:hypothetical protein n=1 Tax=Nordella sp. HKS 07 TaxID=2712222 RepID=UPI0013E19330|nr:hypothetical protein [Nordella sp. HKS 07]QIG47714.1 hypothetical protein G5V57_08230 [Nordella sp. HKS 07]